jgi:integrase
MRERPPGSGQWQLRAFAGADPTSGRPVQVSRAFEGTERAAAKALAGLVADVEAGRFERTRATVSQLLDKWLEQIEPTRRPTTIAEYRSKIDKRIRPALGGMRLDKLGSDTLDGWYRKWLAEGISPSTVHHLHAILSAALNQAVKWGWIERSPAGRSSPPPLRQTPMKIPTPEQLNRLHRGAGDVDQVLATAIALAALTGARRGELVALRWSDVDLVAGRVRIARSLTVVAGVAHEGPTKTHQIRDIALDEAGVGLLRSHWDYMRDLSTRAESTLVKDPFILSYNANGAMNVGPDVITHRFASLAKRLGMAFRFHDLRHFSVSTLIAAGVDVRTVAERHGHAQATMTLNRYAHALPERDRVAARILGQVLSSGG